MRVAAFLISYGLPIGGPMMTAELLERVAAEGHEVRLYADRLPEGFAAGPQESGLFVDDRGGWLRDKRRWSPDVVVAHPDMGPAGFLFAKRARARYVAVVHNTADRTGWSLRQYPPDTVVWNAEATRLAHGGRGGVVVRSPLRVADHKVSRTGRSVTLVNLSRAKGSEVFYALAERLRPVPFLGVRGGYGGQYEEEGPNVTLTGPLPHEGMAGVWGQTRVLLMPSEAESWGRAALEAACSGIPVVCSDLPGLREALGEDGAAEFVPVGDVDGFERATRRLLEEPGAWRAASRAARARAAAVERASVVDVEQFVGALEGARRAA